MSERSLAPRPDVRLGGTWTPAQRRKNDLIFALARSALGLARAMPDGLLDASCAALALGAWAALGRERRRADAHLRRALGSTSPGSRAVFRGLGSSLADTVRLLRGDPAIGPRLGFPDEARRVFTDALAAGRGVVLATAHLGPWERLGAALVEAGLPVVTVARESYDPRFASLYEELRERRGLRVLYRGRPGFPVAVVRALRSNRVLALPMDLGGRGVRTVDAPLLGGVWPLAVGPAELALRTGAALIVATPMPGLDGTPRVEAERIALDPGDAHALTLRIGERLERRLRAWPERWPWMHPAIGPSGRGVLLPVAPPGR